MSDEQGDPMEGVEESGNQDQNMDIDSDCNDQQDKPSSSGAVHQNTQNTLHDQQTQHSSSSASSYWTQNNIQPTNAQQALSGQMMQSGLFSHGQVVTKQPSSINGQGFLMKAHDYKDINAAGAGSQDSRHLHQNSTPYQTTNSDSEQNKISPAQIMQSTHQDLNAAGAGSQDSRHSLDHMKHHNNTHGQTNNSDLVPNKQISAAQIKQSNHQNLSASAEGQDSGSSLDKQKQPEEDILRNGDENKTLSSQAPEDTATFKIKVISPTTFTPKNRIKLEGALQSWFAKPENQGEKQVSVLSLKLMDDGTHAEVTITPPTALKTLKKHQTVFLNLKLENKEMTVQICVDETHSVTASQNTSKLDKNRSPSSEVNRIQPVTSDDTNNGAGAATSIRDPSESKTAEKTRETSSGLPVPLHQFWYMLHAYRKELEQIEQLHGVSMDSEVSVSFKPTQRSSPDSVSKASEDFQKLLTECVDSFSEAAINHNDMHSVIVKETLRNIQSEKTKMMCTMSARDCRFYGPKKFTDMIKRETTRAENQFKNNSNEMDGDNVSPQRRSSLDMDVKDLQTQLEMDKGHWDLMKLSYKEQLSQFEKKYGVSFNEEKLQKNVIKVQARSKVFQHFNLESHAIRALTHLYQKLASAAVSCELRNPKHEADVAPLVDKLQQQHYCVVAADRLSPWKLVGLPEHLGPAIADIEKTLQKDVFDDKMKKLIGYSGDIPHSRGLRWSQTPDYVPGAVGGAGRDEGVNFRGPDETATGFNKEAEHNPKHDSKGAHAEEETCAICMDSFTDKTKLKCGHEFCQECINMSVKSLGSICPVCKEVFGKLEGNQPEGTMKITKSRLSLPGYPHCGTIEITYNIPSGIQTEKHPNPGKPYHGAGRRAYLPDNHEGNEVLTLLQRAFQQKLIFTVGRSTTSGADNVVTWNDIHHKTSAYGGPESYGYPDPDYLKRVKDELKAKGIK